MAQHIVDIALNATKRQKCTVEVRQEDDEIIVDDQAAEVVPDLHLRKETCELIAKLKQQLKSTPVIPEMDFKRMILIVEKEAIGNEPEDPVGSVQTNAPSRISVELPVE